MKMITLVFAASFLLGCSSPTSSGDGVQGATPLTLNAQFKTPILKLVEGYYGANCTRTINSQAATASPIKVSGDGIITWGDTTDDLTKLNTSTFSLSRNYFLNTLTASFEIRNLTTGNRTTLYEIKVDTTGKVTAMVTVHASKTVNTCEGASAPPGISTSLWSEALKYITVNETSISCTDSTNSSTATGVASMTETEAKALNRTVLKSEVTSESIFVYDQDAGFPAGLIYHALTNTSRYATLAITSEKKLNSLQITNADSSQITCKTPAAKVP